MSHKGAKFCQIWSHWISQDYDFVILFDNSLPVGGTLDTGVLELLSRDRKFNLGGLFELYDEELDENRIGEPRERHKVERVGRGPVKNRQMSIKSGPKWLISLENEWFSLL